MANEYTSTTLTYTHRSNVREFKNYKITGATGIYGTQYTVHSTQYGNSILIYSNTEHAARTRTISKS